MTDVWELAAFVEEHPDDYVQRWHLAKKLYAEHEYRLALEHLQLLNKDWTPKLNVQRYLAATFYRLGRYTEAEEHLLKTIQQWPDESGPIEQLAHVYRVDGKLKEALDAWRRVIALEPGHALAERAIKNLEAAVAKSEKTAGPPVMGVFMPNLTADEKEDLMVTGNICPQCGAQNSDEFETCWQCNASLSIHTPSFLNTPPIEAHGPYLLRPETATALMLISTGILLVASAVQGVRLMLMYKSAELPVLTSLDDLGVFVLPPARLALGIVMALCWPLCIMAALRLFRVSPRPPDLLIYIFGLLLGALTLLLVLLPMPFPVLAVGASGLLSLAVMVFTFRLKVPVALGSWIVHFGLVWLVGLLAFWFAESRRYGELINPFTELPAVSAALSGPEALRDAMPTRLPKAITPFRQKVRWNSTGSSWLDRHLEKIDINVYPEAAAPGLRFQIYQGEDLRYHHDLQGTASSSFTFAVVPGTEYELVVQGADNIIIPVSITSLMSYEFVQ